MSKTVDESFPVVAKLSTIVDYRWNSIKKSHCQDDLYDLKISPTPSSFASGIELRMRGDVKRASCVTMKNDVHGMGNRRPHFKWSQ